MDYNLLSGTVEANEKVVIQPPGEDGANLVEGKFFGDGTNITNVARVVANGTTDYLVSIGANSDSVVGEPNLRFNGSRLLVVGQVTASNMNLTSIAQGTATTSSYLALDSNNNIVLTSSAPGGASGGGGIALATDAATTDATNAAIQAVTSVTGGAAIWTIHSPVAALAAARQSQGPRAFAAACSG